LVNKEVLSFLENDCQNVICIVNYIR